ncbi:MAG: heme-binding protein [Sphingomonadaceae bacterium]|nr:heme-binding protein [Sphingomonadaceae bacterium]
MATTTRKPAAKRTGVTKRKAPAAKPAAATPSEAKPVKPAAAPKATRAPAKRKAPVAKPKVTTRSAKLSALAAKPKAARAAIPVPQVTTRQAVAVAAGTGGILAAAGAALFLWRASKADQPEYIVVERDGDFEVREYPALVTAATEARGPRDAALDRGFRTLADYLFAKSRSGAKLAMTAPVLSDGGGAQGWRTRFIMPLGTARADLPAPPTGVTLASEPPRRMAAVRFSGRANDAALGEKEGALRSWLQLKSLPSEAKAEHAFYNSPMMPGPFRRNEVLVPLSTG